VRAYVLEGVEPKIVMSPTPGRPVVATDVLVAVVVAAMSIGALLVSDEPGARAADPLGVGLLVVLALPLVLRRWRPVWVMVGVGALALLIFMSGYSGGPPTFALLVALYAVAAAGHRWWTVVVVIFFAGVGLLFRALVEQDPPVSIVLDSALFVLVSLLGDAVHSRRRLAIESAERLRLAEAEREADARRRVTEERLRIARELHDVMAHSVTSMSVQAGAASDVLDARPDEARHVLRSMRTTARQAMQELRATVSLLRDDTPSPAQAVTDPRLVPRLANLDALAETFSHGDLEISVATHGRFSSLSPAVDLTAYRVVQEALTNVVRHAQATCADVEVTFGVEALAIQVDDDGVGPRHGQFDGFGLRGLAERVDALDGSMRTGTTPSGGFRLRVELPLQDAS
jgi:signal transduction histidine kinase